MIFSENFLYIGTIVQKFVRGFKPLPFFPNVENDVKPCLKM